MSKLLKYRVLLAGILSPILAALLGLQVYIALTRSSTDRNQDFVYRRLSLVTIVIMTPFLLTFVLAVHDRRRRQLTLAGKVGLTIAVLSLGLTWMPLRGLIGRSHWRDCFVAMAFEAWPGTALGTSTLL